MPKSINLWEAMRPLKSTKRSLERFSEMPRVSYMGSRFPYNQQSQYHVLPTESVSRFDHIELMMNIAFLSTSINLVEISAGTDVANLLTKWSDV